MWSGTDVAAAGSALGVALVGGAFKLGQVVGSSRERAKDSDRRLERLEHHEGYWNAEDHPGRRHDDRG